MPDPCASAATSTPTEIRIVLCMNMARQESGAGRQGAQQADRQTGAGIYALVVIGRLVGLFDSPFAFLVTQELWSTGYGAQLVILIAEPELQLKPFATAT